MLAADDVFDPLFFRYMLFIVPGEMQQLPYVPRETIDELEKLGAKQHLFLRSEESVLSGPYFLSSGRVRKVLKLYPDAYGAFMYGVIQSDDGFERSFTDLIPVPSRLYSKNANKSLPLAGKRIAVKDIIDLYGLETSASSKAYAAYHGPAKKTAAAVQMLIDLGAVVIGKTKTTQFATGETAQDWIEFQCPFNPRADGFLDPAGSSTGSAAAVAGYDWVDYALGTDSTYIYAYRSSER
ncbi:Amidase [Dactylellina cionopaga]|nr:Amidase [Dactylellina cionopaga]